MHNLTRDRIEILSIPAGNAAYRLGNVPCLGVGLTWSTDDLDVALHGQIRDILSDKEGKSEIASILSSLAESDFAQDALRRVLMDTGTIENWRVGEAIADAYLTDHRMCCFPWPDSRDERKSGSSLPGADLVGLGKDNNGDCLAFGEVKTSSVTKYPPGNVIYGHTSLKMQLKALRDQVRIRDELLKYLASRAKGKSWCSRFRAATRRYLKNSSDIQIYGVLVRDVPANDNDLKACVQKLAANCPNETRIELIALYLPKGSINDLGNSVVDKQIRIDE